MKDNEYWKRLFDEQAQSGQTQKKFCESKGISHKSFSGRKSRMNIAAGLGKKRDSSNFIRLKKETLNFNDSKISLESLHIKTKSGIEIEFPISSLPMVLKILNEDCGL